MSGPLISVIIPVYNAEKYLSMTLQSVQQQTFKDFEVICIDDGSTDGSMQILERFAVADERFKVHHQTNAGGSASRNKGLDLASGKYIAFLDNDDIYHPQYLEILHHNIEAHDADISCCTYLRFESEHEYQFAEDKIEAGADIISTQPFTDKFVHKKKIDMLMWTKLYRREIFDDIRFDEKLPAINDILLNIEVLLKSRKAVVCRKPLIAYRIIPTSQTMKPLSEARIQEYKNLCIAICRLCDKYSQYASLLHKIATRYAYGMHIDEYLQRYNPLQDAPRYHLLCSNLASLQQKGYYEPKRLSIGKQILSWAFIHQKYFLLRRKK